MNLDLINNIKGKVNLRFEFGGIKLESTHFENGRNLHSEQYYYAKRFFQNTDNCEEICKLLCSKLEELNLPTSTTLIGFRNYTGLLLNMAIQEIGKYNYALIEHDNSNFIWQHLPILNDNLLIVLPITCTCSTYIKLRKFITDDIEKHFIEKNSSVSDNFINVFLILEKEIEKLTLPLLISSFKKESKLHKIYSAFNWVEIQESSIVFNNKSKNNFVAHPLVQLYSKLHLPESCELCFPAITNLKTEKPLFPTHDNFETPNLIFGFPNFSKVSNQQNLFDAFSSQSKSGTYDIHLYGHTVVNDGSRVVNSSHYMNYIQGDEFYSKNKDKILAFFNKELKQHLTEEDKVIIFITAENKHNSNFLEDICSSDSLSSKSITILRFDPSSEFIDNFISLHGTTLNEDKLKEQKKLNGNEKLKVIYFEEVISAGKTFKLISDFLKHSRDDNPDITDRHGFDLVISLVDRTLLYTHDEIIKKIKSKINTFPIEKFITYFKLNVPIISASHMGNPLIQRIDDLKMMVQQCHLDSLKIYVAREIIKQKSSNIHELQRYNRENIELSYFPFENLSDVGDYDVFNLYKDRFNKKQLDLLKLFVAHEINCELADNKYQSPDFFEPYEDNPAAFIDYLIKTIRARTEHQINSYFVEESNINSPIRNKETKKIEFEIFHDTVIKTLTHHPFIYYKRILEAIFAYNLLKFDDQHSEIENKKIQKFEVFRKLKFLIRRSIELNSNFIISKRFIGCVKEQYSKDGILKIMDRYGRKKDALILAYDNGKISKDFFDTTINNVNYKIKQVATYFPFLLYCYKELVYKNPYRSIKLEEIINSQELLPSQIKNPINTDEELISLISDPYFHFTGMIKAENIFLLNELKELHKQNITNDILGNIEDYADYYFGIGKTKTHHNPIIINARKLVSHSRFSQIKDPNARGSRKNVMMNERGRKMNEVKTAIGNMLHTVTLLESKKIKPITSEKEKESSHDLNSEIKEILNSVLTILQPGLAENSLKYAFFVEFRERNQSHESTDNIYSIFSDENIDNPETIYLNKQGLIYNMLYGLYDNSEAKNPQALISTIKLADNQYYSFAKNYFVESDNNSEIVEKTFEELYKNDLSGDKAGSGIRILEDAKMSLIFRLANLTENNEVQDKFYLKGQAVLLITSNQECNTNNFLNFMSNEKVRLLLLIKEELLEYLQKQFDNDAFNEVLENRKRIIYQKHLRHGLNQYLTAQTKLIDKIWRGVNSVENMEVFKIVSDAIRGQLNATKLIDISERSKVAKGILEEKLQLIIESHDLGDRHIPYNEVNITEFNFDNVELHPSLYDVIIPELVINMKKYCPRSGEKGLAIKFETTTGSLVFSNLKNINLSSEEDGGGEGLKMCNHILGDILKITTLEIISDELQHTVKLKL